MTGEGFEQRRAEALDEARRAIAEARDDHHVVGEFLTGLADRHAAAARPPTWVVLTVVLGPPTLLLVLMAVGWWMR